MASNQKKRCDCPSFAAAPTQLEPTMNKIWVSTRSRRPSSFLRGALSCSTLCSARSNLLVIAAQNSGERRLPACCSRQLAANQPTKMQRMIAQPTLTVPDKLSGTAGWQPALPGIYLRNYPDEG